MATPLTILNRALRLIGKTAATTDEQTDGLISINAMLGSWENERLMCYALREESLTFTAAVSRTIGPTGNLVTARPVEIVQAWVVSSNTSIPVRIISDEEYGDIPDKTSTSDYPECMNYKPTVPDGTVYFYPVPSASGTMKLLTRTPLTAFATIGDTVTLPPGWEEALATNLAIAIAPEYKKDPGPAVVKMASESKANIKRTNHRPLKAYSELPYLVGRHRGNILIGP